METTGVLADRWQDEGLRRVASRALLVGAWAGSLVLAAHAAVYYIGGGAVGMDSHAYWLAGQTEHPYGRPAMTEDAFLYSPVFAQVMRPLALLPWPVFCGLLAGVCAAVYWWLLRPLPMRWRVPALLMTVPELLIGNVYALLAASLVLGLTRPGAVAFLGLTKITPAGVPFLWFLARREWRAAVVSVGVTVGLAVASFAVEPGLWIEWARFLLGASGESPWMYVRLAAAAGLAVVAGRRGMPWLLAPAFWLAMPLTGDGGMQTILALACLPRLVSSTSRSSDSTPAG